MNYNMNIIAFYSRDGYPLLNFAFPTRMEVHDYASIFDQAFFTEMKKSTTGW